MGAEITAVNRELDREIDSNAGGTAGGKTSGSTNPTNTTAGGNTGGNRTGGTGSSTTAGGKTSKEEKELSRLAILTPEELAAYNAGDDTEKRRILRNARKRKKYAEQKRANGGDVKPRKVNSTKTNDTLQPIDVKQLNLIFAGVSSAIASRPGCEHWLLTEGEINSITVPLSKMLAESTMFSTMGQYSNQIALTMACITIFVPRLVITLQKQKEVKRNAVTGQSTNTNVTDRRITGTGTQKSSDIKPDKRNDTKPASNGANDVGQLPWYGNPIY